MSLSVSSRIHAPARGAKASNVCCEARFDTESVPESIPNFAELGGRYTRRHSEGKSDVALSDPHDRSDKIASHRTGESRPAGNIATSRASHFARSPTRTVSRDRFGGSAGASNAVLRDARHAALTQPLRYASESPRHPKTHARQLGRTWLSGPQRVGPFRWCRAYLIPASRTRAPRRPAHHSPLHSCGSEASLRREV